MNFRHAFWTFGLLTLCALSPAQADTTCLGSADIETSHFVGTWSISLAATPGQKPERGVLSLQTHPVYGDSLKGEMPRGAQTLHMVGDWEDDTLTLEESADGQRISATWQARPVPGQCGQVLEGLRFTGSEPDTSAQRFRMRSQRAR